jgi:hypothetical protein
MLTVGVSPAVFMVFKKIQYNIDLKASISLNNMAIFLQINP